MRGRAEPDAIRHFLGLLSRDGPWTLARRGAWQGRTFSDLREAVASAAARNNDGHCVYYLGNERRPDTRTRREIDIIRANGVWIDIDNPDSKIRNALLVRRPTFVVFTGGGWQAHWRFDRPTTDLQDAKAVGLGLQQALAHLNPDSTHSVEHLFRLPGTRNRKPGRGDALATLDHWEAGATLALASAPRAEPPDTAAVDLGDIETDLQLSPMQLRECLTPWAYAMLENRPEGCPSRNEHQWAFIGAVMRDLGDTPHARALVVHCLTRPAELAQEEALSHRTHFAKQAGRLTPRRDPLGYALGQLKSFLEKEGA